MSRTLLLLLVAASVWAAEPAVEEALKVLPSYDYGQPRKPLLLLDRYLGDVTNRPDEMKMVADRLAAMLVDGKTTLAAKLYICGQIPLVGSSKHVATVEKLLGDPKTADMARRAIAAIPGEPSLVALRKALGTQKGMPLVGVIHSLGELRDAQSVPAIAKIMAGSKDPVRQACAYALGSIATADAASALAKVGTATGALKDAQLRCAERLAEKDGGAAMGIYLRLLKSDDVRLKVAALSGMAAHCGSRAVPIVIEALRSEDELLRATGARAARSLEPSEAAPVFAKQLEKLDVEGRVLVLQILADYGDRSVAGTVTARMSDKDPAVRVAAIQAMGRLGDAATVPQLISCITGGRADAERAAARDSLIRLSGKGVDEAILRHEGTKHVLSPGDEIAILAARRAAVAEPMMLLHAKSEDATTRLAALEGLAAIGSPKAYTQLIGRLAAKPDERGLERAIQSIGLRMEAEARDDAPLAALGKASPAGKAALFRVLSVTGGDKALAAVRSGLSGKDAAVVDGAVRALAKWPDAAPAQDLLTIARDSKNKTHRVLALRGALQLAVKAPAKERTTILEGAKAIAKTKDAKLLLLAALGDAPSKETLAIATALAEDGEVKAEAEMAVDRITKALRPRRRPGPAPIKPDPKRSAATKAALAKQAPKGYRLAAYLDCGPDRSDGAKGKATLAVASGAAYRWSGAPETTGTIFYGAQVAFSLSGLDPKRTYQVGLTWWDYDHNTRSGSVVASAIGVKTVVLLKTMKLPSGANGQKPAKHVLPIPHAVTAKGTATITVRDSGGPNAVCSEIWLWESTTMSDPPASTAAPEPKAEPAPEIKTSRKARPCKVLLVTGDDYGGHKWRLTTPPLRDAIEVDERIGVDVVEDPNFLASPKIHDYKAIVFHWKDQKKPAPGPEAQANFKRFVANGGGVVYVHFACGAWQKWPEFVQLAGRVWNPKFRGHDPHGKFRVDIIDQDHPITKGMKPFETVDELYTCLDGKVPIHVIADAKSKVDKKLYPMAFVLTHGKGRIFHCVLGHSTLAFEAEGAQALFRRGTAWTAGLAVEPNGK